MTATNTNRWSPRSVTVAVGGTVQWSWSGAVQPHNVAVDGHGATDFSKDGGYTVTFTAPGTYDFTCQSHPGMDGTVTVIG